MNDPRNAGEKLCEIKARCRKLQAKTRRPIYPVELMESLSGIVESGMSIKSVSEATGVSQGALRKWSKRSGVGHVSPVKILPVVNDREL